MATIHMTRGIQASGKSTFARAWVKEDPHRRVRVNRDDLRRMLYGGKDLLLTWEQEQNVTAVERAIAKVALEKGKDVVIDAMNLRDKWVKPWFTLGYPVEFHDFEVSFEEAIVRNNERGGPVPNAVIEKAYRTLTRDGKLKPPPAAGGAAVRRYEPDEELPQAYLFDVDGTLAHHGERSPYDYSRVSEDTVDRQVAHLANALGEEHYIIILSGREDSCRDATETWLYDNNIRFDELHMRRAGDTRKDANIKAEIFDQHIRHRFNVLGVVDDRNQVVRMWREMGLKCFQAQKGDF